MEENRNGGCCYKCGSPALLQKDPDYQGEPIRVEFPIQHTFMWWKAPLIRGTLCCYHKKQEKGLFGGNAHGCKDLFKFFCL